MTSNWTGPEKRQYYRDYFKKRREVNKANGICVSCTKKPAVVDKSSCQQCLDDKKLCAKFGKAGPFRNLYSDLFERQGGKCAVCQEYMLRPVLDHCHNTMEVRGLLCSKCNNGLGQFNDDIDLLNRAIAYLRNDSKNRTTITQVRSSY